MVEPVSQAIADIEQRGYTVLPQVLAPDAIATVRRELAPHLQGKLMGRNEFEGFASERVYALLAKAPSIATLVEHPQVLELTSHFLEPSYLLSAAIAIYVHPGETAQAFHFDDGGCRQPRPRPMHGVSTIWAIDDFTAENGATDLIPHSHLWGDDRQPAPNDPAIVPIEMPAGSVVVFAGTLYHRGGANRSKESRRLGITIQYCQPWLRQLENMVLAVPPEKAGGYSHRLQELLGYSIAAPSFMGYVDGVHPRRLVDPKYRSRKLPNDGIPEMLRTNSEGDH